MTQPLTVRLTQADFDNLLQIARGLKAFANRTDAVKHALAETAANLKKAPSNG